MWQSGKVALWREQSQNLFELCRGVTKVNEVKVKRVANIWRFAEYLLLLHLL
jgi:hypothetical protein